jgi:perosamine synthetase
MSWANLTPNAKRYVNDVLDTGWLSRHKYIPAFESAVAQKHGAKHGIFVNSGTDALRISLATLKEIERWPSGSKVIVPALTFVATVNAILQNNLTPVFCDVDLTTANLIPDAFQRQAVAVVPVHLFGLPVAIPKSKSKIVEDSCETFGVHHLKGELACFSFFMSHHVPTGVGGMIVTNNAQYARLARSYANHGRIDDGSHFKFGRSGFSSRATEMEAALGMAALEHFDEDLNQRRKLADLYYDQLGTVLELMVHATGCHEFTPKSSWMFYPILIHGTYVNPAGKRDKLLLHLRKNGIESREAMPLVNQPVFKDLYKKGSCPNAENWTKNGLLLPLHPLMSAKDVSYVCEKVNKFFA